jgi:hypothetical protein
MQTRFTTFHGFLVFAIVILLLIYFLFDRVPEQPPPGTAAPEKQSELAVKDPKAKPEKTGDDEDGEMDSDSDSDSDDEKNTNRDDDEEETQYNPRDDRR